MPISAGTAIQPTGRAIVVPADVAARSRCARRVVDCDLRRSRARRLHADLARAIEHSTSIARYIRVQEACGANRHWSCLAWQTNLRRTNLLASCSQSGERRNGTRSRRIGRHRSQPLRLRPRSRRTRQPRRLRRRPGLRGKLWNVPARPRFGPGRQHYGPPRRRRWRLRRRRVTKPAPIRTRRLPTWPKTSLVSDFMRPRTRGSPRVDPSAGTVPDPSSSDRLAPRLSELRPCRWMGGCRLSGTGLAQAAFAVVHASAILAP